MYTSITSLKGNKKPMTIDDSLTSRESYFFWIRKQYNQLTSEEKKSVIGSAMLLFLNKTCFKGIFRVGPNGFNVPFGNNNNPEIANINHILEVSELIKNVVFTSCPFETSFENITDGDFTYLDPPYVSKDATTKSFVAYTKLGFEYQQHLDLFKICNDLKHKNIKMMMSNSSTELVTDNFTPELYTIDKIVCKRLINSSNPNDTAKEVIIRNY
jgi:DNA adenine methylase